MVSRQPKPAVAMDGTAGVNLARMASRQPKPAVAMDGTAGVKKRAKGLEPSTSSLGS
jgi:hypothetical protein